MRLLSITAQKPDSTGSGVYLTELVRGFGRMEIKQAVVAGVSREDTICLPEKVQMFPVCFETEELPYPVVGMSDEMPYKSTRYSDMTEQMTQQLKDAFEQRIHQAVQEFCPDVILCHHLYFLAAMVRQLYPEIPVYGISHGSDLRQIKKNGWQREYIRRWIPKLNVIFALHQEQKEEICRLYACNEEQIQVIGTGYNSEVFYIEEAQKQRAKQGDSCKDRPESEKLRLIFAGKISEKKGVKSLIRSMQYLKTPKNVSLTLAGGAGSEVEYRAICEEAEKCPAEVTFTGRMMQKELAHRMNQSDVFVLPSFYEGLPLVVVEALACGLRVVCTDLPGIKSWLDANIPGHGVVFVEPPAMVNEDEPIEAELPLFERRLAAAVEKAVERELPQREAVERISWCSLCGRLADRMSHRQ
ncbi:glycosyltransferase family 4 protein [Faecalicatena sp. AGMB00832]|uniref:Glycosyltransferase family 4 protein n=1 Tax=Faecalicatena faecalis TaxID=2726362 RepID=A0ABS6D2L9_9FIRM|nr:glycosyltransferase family 4 protein [Faecalicatena faecalis]MBU3875575.1 glycosyltransferase family 4 protein [Faecalicatena faecalis]